MTLSFKTQINDKPTYFVEKILNSIDYSTFDDKLFSEVQDYIRKQHNDISGAEHICLPEFTDNFTPKIHTIREDKKNRWKVGKDIHMVVNNRTPDRFQFVPIQKVISIQDIWIRPDEYLKVNIDNVWLDDEQIELLAENDGFENTENFFEWFNKDFSGKIIHWTEFKY